ncbi:hypothetical protein [Spirosoma pomorum]
MKIKFYLTSLLLLILASPLAAQSSKIDIVCGLGGAAPYTYGGVWFQQTTGLVFLEPYYHVSDHMSLSLHLENLFPSMYKATYNATETMYGRVRASFMPSAALMVNYHLFNRSSEWQLRYGNRVLNPFISAGIGTFFRGQGELISQNPPQTIQLGICTGVLGRLGVMTNRWVISTEMNVLNENRKQGSHKSWWGGSMGYRGRSYVSLKVGYTFK